MIEPTDEMIEAQAAAFSDRMGELLAVGGAFDMADPKRAGLAAVLAIVERDYKVVHRSAWGRKAEWPLGRGGSHPHYCVSCSDGVDAGPGCGNCRWTGYDQTPWPKCEGCTS